MTQQNPLALLGQFSPNSQNILNSFAQGQQLAQQRAQEQRAAEMHPLAMQQAGLQLDMAGQQQQQGLAQEQSRIEGLQSEANVKATADNLVRLNTMIGQGATEEQIAAQLQSNIETAAARGGNAEDSMVGLQVLQEQGLDGFNDVFKQSYDVFVNNGLINPQEDATAKVGRFKEGNGYTFDSATGDYTATPEYVKAVEDAAVTASLNDLRGVSKDLNAIKADAGEVRLAAEDLKSLTESGTPADQLAIIFKFMKALDPRSVVREGEQVQVMKTGGIFDYFSNVIGGLNDGQKLTAEQMENIVSSSQVLANNKMGAANNSLNSYIELIAPQLNENQLENLNNRMFTMFEVEEREPYVAPVNQVKEIDVNIQALDDFISGGE